MRNLRRTAAALALSLSALFTCAPPAHANCMDDVGDAIAGLFSGGISVAACETIELIDSIRRIVAMVSELAGNVSRDAQAVANAALGAIEAAAGEVRNALADAQRALNTAVADGRNITSPQMVMAPVTAAIKAPVRAPGTVAAPKSGAPIAVAPAAAAPGGSAAARQVAPQLAPAVPPADPTELAAALNRANQLLGQLQGSLERDIAGRVSGAAQQALNQANAKLGMVGNIVESALLAPIHALINAGNDLIADPTRLLDPVATLNTMVENITRSIVDTMMHINDVITADAVSTLRGIENDIHRAHALADAGTQLVDAMRHAHQQKSAAALQVLQSKINAAGAQAGGGGGGGGGGGFGARVATPLPVSTRFQFASVHNNVLATKTRSLAPSQGVAAKLRNEWSAVKAQQQGKARQLDAGNRQRAEAEVDRLFRGKSSQEAAQVKADLLARARQKYGRDAKVMAAIEQGLDRHLETRFQLKLQGVRPALKL